MLKSTSNRSTAHFLGNQPYVLKSLQIMRVRDTFPKVEQAGLSNASTTSLTLNGCTLGQATQLDLEFVTRVTSLARVKYFWAQVNLSRINRKKYPFCVICLIWARNVIAFHKVIGVSLYLGRKKMTIYSINMSKTSSIFKFLPKISQFTCFLRQNLKY